MCLSAGGNSYNYISWKFKIFGEGTTTNHRNWNKMCLQSSNAPLVLLQTAWETILNLPLQIFFFAHFNYLSCLFLFSCILLKIQGFKKNPWYLGKSKAGVMHAQVLIYLHQLIPSPWCKPISIQPLMESLSVRLAFRNACHRYRTPRQNFANKTSRINGLNSIDNDLMWNIHYRRGAWSTVFSKWRCQGRSFCVLRKGGWRGWWEWNSITHWHQEGLAESWQRYLIADGFYGGCTAESWSSIHQWFNGLTPGKVAS